MIMAQSAERPELISIAEACRRFDKRPQTIYSWIRNGDITKYVRDLGNIRTFVDAHEIEAALEIRLAESGDDDADDDE